MLRSYYRQVCLNGIDCDMGLGGRISLVEEMQFRSQRPDVWIIHSNVPIGIIEVKKPSATIMDTPLLAGQVLDYLGCPVAFCHRLNL